MVDGIKNKEYLLSLTLRQLRQEASKLSVPLYSRKTKAVLIELIDKYQQKASETYKKTLPKNTSPKISSFPSQQVKEEIYTKIVFLPRDPEWAYVFWQISESDRDKAQSLGANKLCLRLYDASGIGEGNLNQGTLREIAVAVSYTHLTLPTKRIV